MLCSVASLHVVLKLHERHRHVLLTAFITPSNVQLQDDKLPSDLSTGMRLITADCADWQHEHIPKELSRLSHRVVNSRQINGAVHYRAVYIPLS